MKKFKFPNNKKFAFTIVDDTDYSTVENTKPIYDLLAQLNIKTTKTVWQYPCRDGFSGGCLQDQDYRQWILQLQQQGFEIGSHGVGSGGYKRTETLEGYEQFKSILGDYPKMFVNHASNIDNIFWGRYRFSPLISRLYSLAGEGEKNLGADENNEFFWGDFCKKQIKYIRNRCFSGLNTLKYDPNMPYIEKIKEKYTNYWFSSSEGCEVETFTRLISKKNVDALAAHGGIAIVYTHFGIHFVDEDGNVNKQFEENLKYLASKDGWFVPASTLLDFMLESKHGKVKRCGKYSPYLLYLDIIWLTERIFRKIFHKI